eukprot:2076026-Rhodomonas_salina.1
MIRSVNTRHCRGRKPTSPALAVSTAPPAPAPASTAAPRPPPQSALAAPRTARAGPPKPPTLESAF